MGEQNQNGTVDERRVHAMISRATFKLLTGLLGAVSLAIVAWGSWLSATVIDFGNNQAAHKELHLSIENRLVAGNERMNIIQQDIQKMSDGLSTLRGEYEEIKRQLKKSGNWPIDREDPARYGSRPRAAAARP